MLLNYDIFIKKVTNLHKTIVQNRKKWYNRRV